MFLGTVCNIALCNTGNEFALALKDQFDYFLVELVESVPHPTISTVFFRQFAYSDVFSMCTTLLFIYSSYTLLHWTTSTP